MLARIAAARYVPDTAAYAEAVVIRDADPDHDAAACLAIYAPYVRETPVSFEEDTPTLEEFSERIRAAVATHAWLVCEDDDGHITGYAYGGVHRTRAAYRWTTEVTVYVDRSRQRAGIGRRLYERLFERLRGLGFQLAVAGITLPNDASVGLHRAVGFQPVGVYTGVGWKMGHWHDVSWWQLELQSPRPEPPPELRAGP
jgi:L-amino acid N-acyltransferase YncA